MARDYGRKGNTRQKSNTPRQFLWILASFLGGYLAATVFDFASLTTWLNHNVLAEKQPVPSQAKPVARQADKPKPKFEFYTLLSKDSSAPVTTHRVPPAITARTAPPTTVAQTQTVNQSTGVQTLPKALTSGNQAQVVVKESKPVPPVNTTAPAARQAYLVQLAAFNRREDAERLKALLALRGFNASISTVAQQRVNWFRVAIGPFHSLPEAEKAQANVARSERIKGIIRKFEV